MNKKLIHTLRRISFKEQLFFFERLSFLLRANVPLLKSLSILENQGKSALMKELVGKVISELSNGQSFWRSLEHYQDIFGSFSVNIIRVGEESGMLSKNLEYLSQYQKKRHIFIVISLSSELSNGGCHLKKTC